MMGGWAAKRLFSRNGSGYSPNTPYLDKCRQAIFAFPVSNAAVTRSGYHQRYPGWLEVDSARRHAELTRISNEMEIALMRQQLRCGDVLNRDGIVGGIRYDGVAVRVVVYCGKQGIKA
jgi:hypothetical protein